MQIKSVNELTFSCICNIFLYDFFCFFFLLSFPLQHLNLQFSRLVSVNRDIYPARRNLVVEAYNPDAAHVPMKLEAIYSHISAKLLKFKASLPGNLCFISNHSW